jgi:hypothetical protein
MEQTKKPKRQIVSFELSADEKRAAKREARNDARSLAGWIRFLVRQELERRRQKHQSAA